MTRLSAAMCRRLCTVPDANAVTYFDGNDLRTLNALAERGLVIMRKTGWFQRTERGRETAERLRRAEK